MNTLPIEPDYLLGLLFILGVLLLLLAFAFAADALIELLHAKQMREDQKKSWRQYRGWISENGALGVRSIDTTVAVPASSILNGESLRRHDVRGQPAPTPIPPYFEGNWQAARLFCAW